MFLKEASFVKVPFSLFKPVSLTLSEMFLCQPLSMRHGVRDSSRLTSAWRPSVRRSQSDGRHEGVFSSVWWSSSSTTATFGGNRWMTTTSRTITVQPEGLERGVQSSSTLCQALTTKRHVGCILSVEYRGISSCLYFWVDLKQSDRFQSAIVCLWVHSRLMSCRVMVSPGCFACVHYMKDEWQPFQGAAAHLQ